MAWFSHIRWSVEVSSRGCFEWHTFKLLILFLQYVHFALYAYAYIYQCIYWYNMQKHNRAHSVRFCIPESNALDLSFPLWHKNINHHITFLISFFTDSISSLTNVFKSAIIIKSYYIKIGNKCYNFRPQIFVIRSFK